jgi:hypothetical protein
LITKAEAINPDMIIQFYLAIIYLSSLIWLFSDWVNLFDANRM